MADLRTISRLALACCLAAPVCAQQVADPANLTGEQIAPQAIADTLPIDHGAPAVQQLLMKLRSRASMLLIVAHPDDEDGGFLTYESRGQGTRVGMLTLNRGEGGQNLMSADFNDALGLIRTQELLAADRYMGVDQFFGTEVDFGFSKTKEESFEKWTHDRVLYDAVRCVRLYRPLVLASVFVGGVTDGHGQHQVAGEITQEVFLAAADPKVFPEMIQQGLPPWAPLKVYARSPFARIDAQGMFDYATGKYSPVLFHNYVTGADLDHAPVPTVVIHEGEASDRLGMNGDTYIQFARKGLSLQKSQIGSGGRGGPGGGSFDSNYTLMASRLACPPTQPSACPILPGPLNTGAAAGINPPPPEDAAKEKTPFDGIDVTLVGIAEVAPEAPASLTSSLSQLDRLLAVAVGLFQPDHMEPMAAPLRAAKTLLDGLVASTEASGLDPVQKYNLLHELRVKQVQLDRALTLVLGISVEAVLTGDANLVPGHALAAQATVASTGDTPIQILSAALRVPGAVHSTLIPAQPIANPIMVSANAPVTLAFQDKLTDDTPVTRPYFSRSGLEQPFYDIASPALRDAPATPAPVVAVIRVQCEGDLQLELEAVVRSPGSEPTAVPQAATIVPAMSVAAIPAGGIVSLSSGSFTLKADARAETPRTTATLTLALPANWRDESPSRSITFERTGEHSIVPFTVTPARVDLHGRYTITSVAETGGQKFTEGFRAIGYPGLTYTNYYTPAAYRATAVDLHTAPDLKIAYLPGTGDSVPEFLPNLGVTPAIISTKDLTPETLSKFDAIILGVRAYAAHPELAHSGSQPLIDYAKAGGVVIVQYNNARFGADEAPFPITAPMSSGDHAHDVVQEDQPVLVLVPDAPLLNWPNKITSADFDNWVEERGHGFAGTWSSEYTALLETHDEGQDPQKGGLLVAPVGKGAYIYCGLALYRQLPEGVPGAYRLMANLLSYAKNPNR